MKFDGADVQLMVHGEPVRVRSVETAEEDGLRSGLKVLTITGVITDGLEEVIVRAWHQRELSAAFNGGRTAGAREDELCKKNQWLEREIREVRKMLAKRAVKVDLIDLDDEEG